jgi:hypothetical protein
MTSDAEKKQASLDSDDPVIAVGREFLIDIRTESDRAAVVVSGARVDAALHRLLVRFLRPNPKATDELFENNGPLGTFSSRIDLAHRLYLIDAEQARACHLLRKIRNDFAHEMQGSSLEASPHKDRVIEFVKPFRRWKEFDSKPDLFGTGDRLPMSRAFRTASALLLLVIENRADKVERAADQEWHMIR